MAGVAVIVIDMLNAYDHDDADVLAERVAPIVDPLAALIARADADDDAQLVYVNDNYGDFSADRDDLAERALAGRRPELVRPLVPPDDAAFLTKVRHSAFYSTPLAYLLRQQEVATVVLTGQVTEQCILYSALDAYVRHFDLRVVVDAVAAIEPELGEAALHMMRRNMQAELVDAETCPLR